MSANVTDRVSHLAMRPTFRTSHFFCQTTQASAKTLRSSARDATARIRQTDITTRQWRKADVAARRRTCRIASKDREWAAQLRKAATRRCRSRYEVRISTCRDSSAKARRPARPGYQPCQQAAFQPEHPPSRSASAVKASDLAAFVALWHLVDDDGSTVSGSANTRGRRHKSLYGTAVIEDQFSRYQTWMKGSR